MNRVAAHSRVPLAFKHHLVLVLCSGETVTEHSMRQTPESSWGLGQIPALCVHAHFGDTNEQSRHSRASLGHQGIKYVPCVLQDRARANQKGL